MCRGAPGHHTTKKKLFVVASILCGKAFKHQIEVLPLEVAYNGQDNSLVVVRDTDGKLVYDTAVRVDAMELETMVGTLTPDGLQRLVALCSSKEEGGSAARYQVRSR